MLHGNVGLKISSLTHAGYDNISHATAPCPTSLCSQCERNAALWEALQLEDLIDLDTLLLDYSEVSQHTLFPLVTQYIIAGDRRPTLRTLT